MFHIQFYLQAGSQAKYPDSYTASSSSHRSIGHQPESKETWKPQQQAYSSSSMRKSEDFPPVQHRRQQDILLQTPTHRSRSPVRRVRSRSRSPLRDRIRRYSPSSQSPKRSWANEKPRPRSPVVYEAPPPPSWPGASNRRPVFANTADNDNFSDISSTNANTPVWDNSPFVERKNIYEEAPRRVRDINAVQKSRDENLQDSAQPYRDHEYREESIDNKVVWQTRFDEERYSPTAAYEHHPEERQNRSARGRYEECHVEEEPRHRPDTLLSREEFIKRSDEFTRATKKIKEVYNPSNRVQDFNPLKERKFKEKTRWHSQELTQRVQEDHHMIAEEISKSDYMKETCKRVANDLTKKILARKFASIKTTNQKLINIDIEKAIAARLDKIVADRNMPYNEIIFKYRQRYPDDDGDELLDESLSKICRRKRQAEGKNNSVL